MLRCEGVLRRSATVRVWKRLENVGDMGKRRGTLRVAHGAVVGPGEWRRW